MSTYFAILTEVGEAKLANAIALGQTLKLKTMAVGDGNGNLPMPSRTQKALVHEVRRAGLNQLSIDPANASQIIVEQVLPENVGGWWIREIGIYDEAGDLCAVANCPPSYKPVMAEGSARTQVVRIVLIVASTAAIELKIDPSVILATRKYVDDQDITVRAYSDEKLAKHLASLDPHPLLAKVAYVDQQNTSARSYGDQQLAKHQAAADPHPLLAKVAYVDQQLAKHQAAADPHAQYSMKEIATPQKFDASSKLVNADFVQRAQGNMVRYAEVIENRTLTVDDMGCALYFPSAGKTITIPDPISLGIPNNSGKCVRFFGLVNAGTILAGPGVSIGLDVGNVPSITIKQGQFLTLMATSAKVWQVIESTAELWRNADFSGELGVLRNWRRLPNGDIEQWGTIAGSASMAPFTPNLTFPIAFPNACRAITVQCMNELSTAGYSGRTTDKTLSRTGAWVANSNGVNAVPDVLSWRAIGN
ncbi:hypothetical protein JAB1_51890 [Janthinobacterium sp. MP5059B]|uniref:phage tail protein n=1 Tax=Janthinobacterium sp. MP5059B TaxID=1766683 RepID=UPI0008754E38|nr:phage tail protein [Janthinobacterium sp. MP5059B]OEZ46290.1 hypothetical protein JAB1_51890 [Janthinobacterium sp. MP5059B]